MCFIFCGVIVIGSFIVYYQDEGEISAWLGYQTLAIFFDFIVVILILAPAIFYRTEIIIKLLVIQTSVLILELIAIVFYLNL